MTNVIKRAALPVDGLPAVSSVSSVPVTVVNGKYVIERRLGGGGMAEVFLARTVGAEGFSRPVAIKRIRSGFAQDPEFANLFVEEARLTARLQHPNIVQVLDFDRDHEGGLFLVMELVDGVTLHGLLQRCRLPLSLVIYAAIEILRGLDYAHELPINPDGVRGLVHRDLSPDNVLLSWEGVVKVSDFGVAKARAASKATASITIKGKPSYMSPEQVNGGALDGRSDLFAVGAIMFEMLCARSLFSGGTNGETLGQVLYGNIPAVRDIRPDVPEDLSNVVASLLMRDLGKRMPTAETAIAALVCCANCPKAGREELIEALLQHFAERAPMRPRNLSSASHLAPTVVGPQSPVPEPVRVTATATSLPGEASGLGAITHRSRLRRWAWAFVAILVVAAGAAGILAMSGVAGQATDTAAPTPEAHAAPAVAPVPSARAAPALLPTAAEGHAASIPGTAIERATLPSAATPQPVKPAQSGANATTSSAPKPAGATPKRGVSRVPSQPPSNSPQKPTGIEEISLTPQ